MKKMGIKRHVNIHNKWHVRPGVGRNKTKLSKKELKEMLLSKALTCMNFFLYEHDFLFYHEDGYFGYIIVWKIYTSHTDHFTPQQTAFLHSAACLLVVFELLPGFIPFTILWHIGWILDKNVTVNKNYSYPTTIWVSILTQIYVFLVWFTIFAFDLKTFIRKKKWKLYCSTRNLYICVKILSHIVVG